MSDDVTLAKIHDRLLVLEIERPETSQRLVNLEEHLGAREQAADKAWEQERIERIRVERWHKTRDAALIGYLVKGIDGPEADHAAAERANAAHGRLDTPLGDIQELKEKNLALGHALDNAVKWLKEGGAYSDDVCFAHMQPRRICGCVTGT